MDENIESLNNLQENLAEYGYSLDELPFVIQYNKRDLPNIATVEELQQQLNPMGVPYYEAEAITGNGVFATLKAISKLVIEKAQKSSVEKPAATKATIVETKSEPQPQTEQKPEAEREPQSQTEQNPQPEPEPAVKESAPVASDPPAVQPEPEYKTEQVAVSAPATSTDTDYKEAAYSELSNEPVGLASTDKVSVETVDKPVEKEIAAEKPAIVTESETLTNVVVSSDPEEDEVETEAETEEDVEETTEHAVLKDETDEIEQLESNQVELETQDSKHHPDVLDSDKLQHLQDRPVNVEQGDIDIEFDDEATVISDPQQTVPTFNKPQMAESVKIKGKKKSGLFGWLRRKQK
jgi:hypothetical protein